MDTHRAAADSAPKAAFPPVIRWRYGPLALSLAGVARLRLPSGMIAVEGAEMRRFLLASGNALTGSELAVSGPVDLRWFAVISLLPARGKQSRGQREEWTEDTVEADGRAVRIRTVLVPAGAAVLSFEVVSEQAGAAVSAAESNALLAGVELPPADGPAWLLFAPALAVLAGLVFCVYWLIRRRQRGL
jgi:hypothetical protein